MRDKETNPNASFYLFTPYIVHAIKKEDLNLLEELTCYAKLFMDNEDPIWFDTRPEHSKIKCTWTHSERHDGSGWICWYPSSSDPNPTLTRVP